MNAAIAELFRQYHRTPFRMGSHDCVLWCARCIDAQRGTQYEARIKEDFGSPTGLQACRIVRQAGGLVPLVERWLGPMTSWMNVEQGGLIALRVRKVIEIVGIVEPNGALTAGRHGLILIPYDHAIGGWPCPRS